MSEATSTTQETNVCADCGAPATEARLVSTDMCGRHTKEYDDDLTSNLARLREADVDDAPLGGDAVALASEPVVTYPEAEVYVGPCDECGQHTDDGQPVGRMVDDTGYEPEFAGLHDRPTHFEPDGRGRCWGCILQEVAANDAINRVQRGIYDDRDLELAGVTREEAERHDRERRVARLADHDPEELAAALQLAKERATAN